MSDVPELDRMIEESENVRRNMKWRRRDRLFKLSFLLQFLSFPLFFLSVFVFGVNIASFILLCYFCLSLLPLLFEAFGDIMQNFLKDDWEGVDMTKRYQRK